MSRCLLVAFLPLCVAVTGCDILGPDDRVVIRGTVYINDEPAGGRSVGLSFRDTCAGCGSSWVTPINAHATSASDGSYELEAKAEWPWSCASQLYVTVEGFGREAETVRGCEVHEGIDFHLIEAEPLLVEEATPPPW